MTPHILTVHEEFSEDDGGLELEHPPDCPLEQRDGYQAHACDVGVECEMSGLQMSFLHRDDPQQWHYAERLEPGRYEIEFWLEKHRGGWWGPDEYSAGLRVIQPAAEEAS